MCPSVQLDVSVTGTLCRAKPLPNPAIYFLFPLLGQHPLPRWATLAAWAGSPVSPVSQSGITLAAGRSALLGYVRWVQHGGHRSPRQVASPREGWGHHPGGRNGTWQPSWPGSDLPVWFSPGAHQFSSPGRSYCLSIPCFPWLQHASPTLSRTHCFIQIST